MERVELPQATARAAASVRTDFLKLWGGQTASMLGTQVGLVALPLTAALYLDAGPGQMGLLTAAGTAPYLLLGLPAGVRIDRRCRRPVMIGADLARAALLAAIPLLAVAGALTVEILIAIALAIGTCTMLFELAYPSYLPTLVGRDGLVAAHARLSASRSLSEVGGPGLAAVLVQAISAPFVLLLDAVSFLGSALGLSTIRTPEPAPERRGALDVRREVAEGLRTTFGNRMLRAGACAAGTHNLCWGAIEAVLVLYVVRDLGLSASAYALGLAAGAAGGLIGAIASGPLIRRLGMGPAVITCAVVCCTAPLLIPALAGAAPAMLLLAFALFLRGLGGIPWDIQMVTLRQMIVPDELLGRVTSSYMLFSLGGLSLGAVTGGALGAALGLHQTVLLAAAGLSLSWLWLLLAPVRTLRTVDPIPADG
jgi:MFS family permease